MANFNTLAEVQTSTSGDFYHLQQGGIDYKHTRETLAGAISNARWSSTFAYTLGSEVVGSDNEKYVAVAPSIGEDPTTDDGSFWYLVNRTLSPTSVQVLVSSQTYTPANTVKAIKVTLVGGGGSGGGVDGQGVGTSASSSGGGGGGVCVKMITSMNTSYSVVVGAGGASVTGSGGSNGISGGTTTFIDDDTGTDVNLSASGGGGGTGMVGSSGSVVAGRSSGGVASGGDLNITGGDGDGVRVVNGDYLGTGRAGASAIGTSVSNPSSPDNGKDGATYGAGGSGATAGGAVTNYSSGAGSDGVVIIEEYY